MEIWERILSKDEINSRFIRATYAVISKGLIPNKTALAESLGVKPAKFSEILNNRMKVGVDMIAIMCDFYKVSPDWILMSRGDNIFRETPLPKVWVDDEDLKSILPDDTNKRSTSIQPNSNFDTTPFLELIREKDTIIREQAEEIGQLRERIAQLQREKGKNASGAQTSDIANVG